MPWTHGCHDGPDAMMQVMTEQIKAGGKTPTMGASTAAAVQHNSTYNPMAFLPLPYATNFECMKAPPKGISTKAVMPTQTPHLFLTYTSGNKGENTAEAPENVYRIQ